MLTPAEEKKRKRYHATQAENGAAEYAQAAEAEEKAKAEWEAKYGTKLPDYSESESESESESDVEDLDVILAREGAAQDSQAAKFKKEADADYEEAKRQRKKGGNYKLKRYGKTKRRNGKTKRRYGKTKRRNGKTKRTRKIR